jgi:L-lactate dehydrogenase complex protein LldG
MSTARDNILGRVRSALGKTAPDAPARDTALTRIAQHAIGPRLKVEGDLLARFIDRALKLDSTVERLGRRQDIPAAVARYLDSVGVARRAVAWPEFADLDWAGAGVEVALRTAQGEDKVGITGVYAAIAETGTLMILSGADTPTAHALLPDTHIAVVSAGRVRRGMEEAFALIREERGTLPRAVNMISGPSRTGDIEQTIVLGAHGPYRVHLLVLD